jgi:magnesium transporter
MQNTKLYYSVMEHLEQKKITDLKQILNDANEVDIMDTIQNLTVQNQGIVYRLLSKDRALDVFEQLDTDDQQNLLHSFTDEQAIEIVNELAPDDRVKLLDELPATVAKKMLDSLSPIERDMTNLLMGYEAQTAGRIMTPEYVHLHKGITALEALEKVKIDAVEKETIYTIYITDEKRKLEGVISLRDLLIAKPDAKIESIMEKNAATVKTDTDQEEVARILQRLNWLAIPVVDKENRLVGIVTIDDAVDILEEETTEDIMIHAGLPAAKGTNRNETLISGSLFAIWKIRLPFLFITIAAGFLAGVVIEGFEEILMVSASVAVFIPIIRDMGGNVGAQSSTIFSRGLAIGNINTKSFFKQFIKEVGVGLSLGLIVGLVTGTVAGIWQGMPMLGVALGVSLMLAMTLAASLGFLVPFVLIKLKLDEAAGSAPLITSIQDISGLLIYFSFVSLFLRHLVY